MLMKEVSKKERIRNRQLVNSFKNRCVLCGETDKCCLEIHHLHDKKFNISKELYERHTSEVKDELKKCVCLCVNCHRKLHSRENINRLFDL